MVGAGSGSRDLVRSALSGADLFFPLIGEVLLFASFLMMAIRLQVAFFLLLSYSGYGESPEIICSGLGICLCKPQARRFPRGCSAKVETSGIHPDLRGERQRFGQVHGSMEWFQV